MSEDILALCRAMGAGEEQDGLLLPLIEGARAELEHLLRRGWHRRSAARALRWRLPCWLWTAWRRPRGTVR